VGHATEGSRALIGKGFTESGVQRVVAEAMAVNHASRRVMQYALDKADWQRQQQA
jgi:RimJ/RimL family protein N-acetyltransferase